jgi:hypothetical protein
MHRILILTLLLTAGCSTGFNRQWERAAQQQQQQRPSEGMLGRWEGSWKSDRNSHHGKLRCIVTPSTNRMLNAQFHAKYWKIFSFSYAVPLQAQRRGTLEIFEGQADLGKMAGGLYHYNGVVATTNWQSTYRSKADHGSFSMNRVP